MLSTNRGARRAAAVRLGLLIVIFSIASLLSGCCAPDQKEPEAVKSKYGGVLYFGVETAFVGFDVLGLGSGGLLIPSMATLNNLIQEPLFRTDGEGNLIPMLGLSATPSETKDSWDIQLRRGVSFHDGEPFNADAVVHHWRRMLNPENKYRGRKLFQPIQTVEKIDEYAVRFTLAHPWPSFLKVISDELYLAAFIPSPKAVEEETHDRKPMGTGPFKYGKWNSGDHYVVYKNENYWQKDEPFLNKIVFRSIPDHQTRYASLLSGEIDIITLDRGNLIKKAKEDPSLYTYASDGNGAEIVILNHRKPPLDDVRVRRALALANKQELHVKMVYGDAIPYIHHPIGEWFTCTDDGYPEYDPEEARRLLAEYGKPVKLECISSNTSRGRSLGELMQQLYKDVGVELTPRPLATGPHVMNVLKGDFQLASWRIPGSKDMGPQLYRTFLSTSPTNYTGYNNPGMDELLEAQRRETDPEKRTGMLCNIVRQLNEDAVLLYRGGRRRTLVARKKIRNITDVSGVKVNLSTAWIDENIRFNTLAFEIEKKADMPFDCPESGDPEALKAFLRGQWSGTDNYGATITFDFHADETVTGQRTGGSAKTGGYLICGSKIIIKSRALVVLEVAGDKLDGTWTYSSYKGNFIMEKENTSS